MSFSYREFMENPNLFDPERRQASPVPESRPAVSPEFFEQIMLDIERIGGHGVRFGDVEDVVKRDPRFEFLWKSARESAAQYVRATERYHNERSPEAIRGLASEERSLLQESDENRRRIHDGALSYLRALARNSESHNPALSAALTKVLEDENRNISSALLLDLGLYEIGRRVSDSESSQKERREAA